MRIKKDVWNDVHVLKESELLTLLYYIKNMQKSQITYWLIW
jgi:hypothetical protein